MSPTQPPTHLLTHPPTHSPTHSLTHLLTQLTHSLTHTHSRDSVGFILSFFFFFSQRLNRVTNCSKYIRVYTKIKISLYSWLSVLLCISIPGWLLRLGLLEHFLPRDLLLVQLHHLRTGTPASQPATSTTATTSITSTTATR